jgi:hypothetical protein
VRLAFLLGRVLAWSVHLPPVAGSYIKAANKLLDLLEPSVGVMPMVLAGDWNVTVGLRAPDEERQNRPGEAELPGRPIIAMGSSCRPSGATALRPFRYSMGHRGPS